MSKGDFQIDPSPFVGVKKAYRPPSPSAAVDLRLDGNEGQVPSTDLLLSLSNDGAELMRRYPNASPVERQIADMLGLAASQIVLTSGADDALERVIRSVLAPGREMILPVPTFDMFEHFANLTGCTQIPVPWLDSDFPVDEVLATVTDKTALIVLVTPNNPTGRVADTNVLKKISRGAPNALLLIDLAYAEFADEDLIACAVGLPNAVVVRSMSKAWGLAGLRVGWASGPPNVIEWMRVVGRPYSVSSLSIKIASFCLESRQEEMKAFVAKVAAQRSLLISQLEKLGAEPTPSRTNFVLAKFKDADWVHDGLEGLGIEVRSFPDRPYLENSIRITVPGEDQPFSRLSRGIKTVLAPDALLFDIDDTLADVTCSYRRATVATAEAFGAKVTLEQITEAKAKGNANNDWELTRRLIKNQNIDVSLDEVTRCFERFYNGTEDTPGMCETETLLMPVGVLERLAKRVKLGIVTGRPRVDAERFLNQHGIAHLFDAVATMDDGPLKPDPAPVRLAMKKLGLDSAWLVGDTPDDMRAARSAGVVPIGVVAPADDPRVAGPALMRSGAVRVLEKALNVEELLS